MKSFTCTGKMETRSHQEGAFFEVKKISKISNSLFGRNGKFLVFFIFGLAMLMPFNNVIAQNIQGVAPVLFPPGGLAIDGNAYVKYPGDPITPDPPFPSGDWLFERNAPDNDVEPGGVFPYTVSDPVPLGFPEGELPDDFYVYPDLTTFYRDDITNNDPTIFTSSNKINDNPTTYTWGAGSSPNKNEIQNAVAHFSFADPTLPYGNEGDLWMMFFADRQVINGSSYIDFELLQEPLTITGATITDGTITGGSGGFATGASAVTGGRTPGDILVTVEFTQGGGDANVVTRRWGDTDLDGVYTYEEFTPAVGTIFATNNSEETIVPYQIYNQDALGSEAGEFEGFWQYSINQWAEGAVNLTEFFGDVPCLNISTLFIRTRTSGSSGQSELKDFPGKPIQLSFDLTPDAGISTDGVCDGDDSVFTATPAGADDYTFFFDANENGMLDGGEEIYKQGTDDFLNIDTLSDGDVVSVQVTTNGICTDVASAAAIIYDNPDAGISTDGVCDGDDSVFTATPANGDNFLFFEDVNDDGAYVLADDGAALQDGASDTYTASHADGTKIGVVVTTNNTDANCSDTAVTTTVVYDNPDAGISADGVCDGDDSVFTATPANGDNFLFFEDVNDDGAYDPADDGAALQNGASDTYTASHADGTKIGVVVTINNTDANCSDTAVTTTVVYDNPDAGISTDGVCDGDDSVFTATPANGDNFLFFEDVNDDGAYVLADDGAALQNGASDTYTASHTDGTKIGVVVTINNADANCSDTAVTTTVVYDNPTADLQTASVCVGDDAVFTATPTGNGEKYTFWVDTNLDGVVDIGETVLQAESTDNTYNSNTIADGTVVTVLVETTNGCTDFDTATAMIEICITGEGCTLGYWKNHTNKWCSSYTTCTLYSSVFTPSADFSLKYPNLTFLQALNLEGNTDGENLARQSVAALLNACSSGVGFDLSEAQVIAQTNAAWLAGGTEINSVAIDLDVLNNAGCPLGGGPSVKDSPACRASGKPANKVATTDALKADALNTETSVVVNSFSAYPVPFRESLNIQYDFDYVSDAVIQMYDMQGRLLSTQKEANAYKGKVTNLSINFRTLPSQVYVIKVTTDRDVFTKKIISDK